MTLLDSIRSAGEDGCQGGALAADLIDAWHNDQLAGELAAILG